MRPAESAPSGEPSCHWNDLGNVTRPGYYRARDVGVVEVRREDLDEALHLGGNPVLRLGELNARQSQEPTYGILSMRSSDQEENR